VEVALIDVAGLAVVEDSVVVAIVKPNVVTEVMITLAILELPREVKAEGTISSLHLVAETVTAAGTVSFNVIARLKCYTRVSNTIANLDRSKFSSLVRYDRKS
jgi:hypothetical protein